MRLLRTKLHPLLLVVIQQFLCQELLQILLPITSLKLLNQLGSNIFLKINILEHQAVIHHPLQLSPKLL
jgi:hypothetical protein